MLLIDGSRWRGPGVNICALQMCIRASALAGVEFASIFSVSCTLKACVHVNTRGLAYVSCTDFSTLQAKTFVRSRFRTNTWVCLAIHPVIESVRHAIASLLKHLPPLPLHSFNLRRRSGDVLYRSGQAELVAKCLRKTRVGEVGKVADSNARNMFA